jgi:hypothetical protein
MDQPGNHERGEDCQPRSEPNGPAAIQTAQVADLSIACCSPCEASHTQVNELLASLSPYNRCGSNDHRRASTREVPTPKCCSDPGAAAAGQRLTDRPCVIPPPETIFDREPWEPKVLELKTGGSIAYRGAVAEQVKPVAVFRSPRPRYAF